MNAADTKTLIAELQRSTALGRIGLGELNTAFDRLAELGYVITAPATPISSRSDTP